MLIISFGTGSIYQKYKSILFRKSSVIALADNDAVKQGTMIDGIPVIAPNEIPTLQYDYIVLMLGFNAAAEVRKQLMSLGITEDKILFYQEYIALVCRGEKLVYTPRTTVKVGIVSTDLNYNGGTIAVISAARAMCRLGYELTIISPYGDEKLIKEITAYGITVIIYPSFLNIGTAELDFVRHFDFVIVNVLQCIDCAIKISDVVPMLWWIHEPSDHHANFYKNIALRYPYYLCDKSVQRIPIFAVSSVAARAFHSYFPSVPTHILPYCVQDELCTKAKECTPAAQVGKISFALIAGFSELKQQHLYLQAAAKLVETHTNCRFLLIGNLGNSAYSQKVLALAKSMPSVELRGVLTREQMLAAYQNEIDVVVCPSLEECLPTVIAEGMMHSKLCIVSDNTGMADYITDGENGFICKAGSLESLYEKMVYCAEHFGELDSVRKNARKTYEENFTMDIFAKRIDRIIKDSLKNRGGYSSIVLSTT